MNITLLCQLMPPRPFQIGVFVYHVLILTNDGKSVGPNGPAYIKVETFCWHDQTYFIGFGPSFCVNFLKLCLFSE